MSKRMSIRREWALLCCAVGFSALSSPLSCGQGTACTGPSGLCIAPPRDAASDTSADAGVSGQSSASGAAQAGAANAIGGGPPGSGGAGGVANRDASGTLPFPGIGGGSSGGDASGGETAVDAGVVGLVNWASCPSFAAFSDTCGATAGTDSGAASGAGGGLDCGPDSQAGTDSGSGGGGSTIGGADAGPPIVPPTTVLFTIDDFEDRDARTQFVLNGRGHWYSAPGPLGKFFPAPCFVTSIIDPSLAVDSKVALHVYGAKFMTGGQADVGVFFRANAPECDQPLDASSMTGIRFKARTGTLAPTDRGMFRVSVQTVATNPTSAAGTCTTGCSDAHGAYYYALPDQWLDYHVPFSRLIQQGWGQPATFDPSKILALVWSPKADTTGATAGCFDYWIDDVAFYQDR
jgi:hypothetical protein